MKRDRVCVMAGSTGVGELKLLKKYAGQGCHLAIMNDDWNLGSRLKTTFEKEYGISVFFFHGKLTNEEDREMFLDTVEDVYGGVDYLICHAD